MTRLLKSEMKERDRFHHQYGRYLGGLINGLDEALPCANGLEYLWQTQQRFISHLPLIDLPDQVTIHYPGTWDRELGDPPESLLPLVFEGYVNDASPIERSNRNDLDASWDGDEDDDIQKSAPHRLEVEKDDIDDKEHIITQQELKIMELEQMIALRDAALKEEKEKELVAVEASSNSYLEALQHIAQITHYVPYQPLSSPEALLGLEERIRRLDKFKSTLVDINQKTKILDSLTFDLDRDPAPLLERFTNKITELKNNYEKTFTQNQRYTEIWKGLIRILDGPEPDFTLDSAESIKHQISQMKEELNSINQQLKEYRNPHKKWIALSNFSFSDTVIFVQKYIQQQASLELSRSSFTIESPREMAAVYEAVHLGTPNFYLTEETTRSLFKSYSTKPSFVIVNIVEIKEHTTSQDSNPMGLNIGTRFHEVVGEWVFDPVRSEQLECSSSMGPSSSSVSQ
eukprot:NODE_1515_length_1920_cov_34.196995_g1284_i0.p1 GENE.NODE_1515_length_1920_cov_34.196995_g1284_i0~~NODE_1515_length_1920_cov_34.196995_g1284_i0.p1  ORF type:complete len:516 (+),score=122.94 NODE_1515_length_1920_cov_34.196995_g1284_i0:175-1548(+)